MANSPLGAVLSRLRTMLEPADADTTDRELLHRFTMRHEEAAFAELVRRHGPMVLGVCRRVLGDAHGAEDAFQATFLVLVRRARAVRWRESLGGWLHGTAWRVALRARRAAGVSRLMDGSTARSRRPLAEGDPSEEAAARELRRVLDQELQGLPAKYRAPLVLCDMEGMTHEQAARELGWPKGSLAKRLNGGRERLRQRLVRRGVGLSAAAVAALTAKEATASVPVALAAAAILAAAGGASTAAAALAKGVVQTMWLTKIKAAAVLALALAVAGTMAGVGAYRTWGARAAASAPAAIPPRPHAEDNEDMPVDKAVVYDIRDEKVLNGLTEGAVVVDSLSIDRHGNVMQFLGGMKESKEGKLAVSASPQLGILAVGPMLQSGEAPESGDEAAVVSLKRHGDDLELEMAYTRGRIAGKAELWRPLVQCPINLAAGSYRLKVTWRARKSLPAGDPLDLAATVSTCEFVVADPMPVGKPLIYHVSPAQGEAEYKALDEGAVFAADRPMSVDDNVLLYRAFFDGQYRQSRAVPVGPHQSILAVGPELGSPDDAAFVGLTRRGSDLELNMVYTSAVAEGKQLKRNVPWRPLVQLPVNLGVGRYRLTVNWQGRKSLPDGEALPGARSSGAREFLVSGAKRKESKAVRVNGADFRAFVESPIRAPAAGGERPVDLGLRVANVSDKTVIFPGYPRLKLTTADGKDVPGQGIDPLWEGEPETIVDPGKAKDLTALYGSLRRTADGKQIQLFIMVLEHEVQFFPNVQPGKYVLTAEYDEDKPPGSSRPFWTGSVKTEPVAFEIVETAANESKPVRVEGLEFTAIAPTRAAAPPPGGKTDADIGMRVVNVSEKSLVLTTFDVMRLRLITPDGKEMDPQMRARKDTPKITPPVTLAPGDHWDWRPQASLQWTTDRATLMLTGPDGRGVAGEWSFTSLHPGRYRLVVEYVNTTMEETQVPNWVGTAATEPVDFEVVATQANESKPVRGEGLEFTALALARVAAPAAGGKTDVNLGMRIVNVSDKPITVWVSDVIRPRLFTADGVEMKADIGRDGTPRPKPPETLSPGESWMWRPDASLSWAPDRMILTLSGPDGRGVGGFWAFPDLHPGKYRLIVSYSSTTTKYIDIPVWAGKAATESVEFEIAGP
jgi:RNA polymerase sigma factor (sigma-70 family)